MLDFKVNGNWKEVLVKSVEVNFMQSIKTIAPSLLSSLPVSHGNVLKMVSIVFFVKNLTCSMTSLRGFPTFCNTVSANVNSGGDVVVAAVVVVSFVDDAVDVAVSGVLLDLSFLFCSFSPG